MTSNMNLIRSEEDMSECLQEKSVQLIPVLRSLSFDFNLDQYCSCRFHWNEDHQVIATPPINF